MKHLLVLAGNSGQAASFAKDYGIPISNLRYVDREAQIRGLREPAYVVVGTFWERSDANAIWDALMISFIGHKRGVYAPYEVDAMREKATERIQELEAIIEDHKSEPTSEPNLTNVRGGFKHIQ